ncbi:MAG: DUF2924 domain-containing protein [Rhizomicrobium sp.]
MAISARHRSKAVSHDSTRLLDARILALAELTISELHQAWKTQVTGDAPPIRSRAILCQLLAWKLQSDAAGSLDSATERALTKIAEALQRDGSYEPKIRSGFSPGVIFSREWKGIVHRVTVAVEGFDYRGKKYRSLSDIARTITGTRWSGPRFFGLEQREQRSSREVAQ